MRVCVLGSRSFTNKELVFNKIDVLNNYKPITEVISGDAVGPDSYGIEYSNKHNLRLQVYTPDWNEYGRSAGMIRNRDLISNSEFILAFLNNNSKGTLNSISLAHKYFRNIAVINIDGSVNRELSKIYRDDNITYKHARRVNQGESYYEVSTKGDTRYSALVASIDGKTIEEIYQLDIKGYREISDDWKIGKGKPPMKDITIEEQYLEYKKLWSEYFIKNNDLYLEILEKAKNKTITDMFATSNINQARAICELCNEGLMVNDIIFNN